MRNNKEKTKKSSGGYKNKSRIFSTKNNAPFMTDYFTIEDGKLLVSEIFAKSGCCNDLIGMLNNSVRYCANLFPNYNLLSPGKGDEKELFDKLHEDFEQTHDDLHLLVYRYGHETFRHINMDRNEFEILINLLKKAHHAMPEAIKSISKSPGKPRGDNASYATRALISSLIRIYERFTNKKAEDNFKQPKADGLNYQGNFYDFCAAVFNIINAHFLVRCGDSQNIFTVQADDSLSLGSHIKKILKY